IQVKFLFSILIFISTIEVPYTIITLFLLQLDTSQRPMIGWHSVMRVSSLKTIGIFIIGIIAVFSLILARNHFATKAASADTSSNLTVFDDQLSSQFSNWSWSSSVNLNNTSPVYSGTASISFTPSAWGGLYFHSNSVITTSSYTSLQFALQTTDAPQHFTVLFYDASNQIAKSVSLSQYTGTDQNGWTMYSIPVSAIPSQINGFAIQENSGTAGPAVYVDAVQFSGTQSQSVSPTVSVPVSNQQYSLYSDTLTSGWSNWSWNSTINFSNTASAYQGTNDISFTTTSGYGGLYLHSDQGVDTTPYQTITFAAKATQAGQ